jgi:alanine racemase
MSRPASAIVDLAALRANYKYARTLHGGRLVAVLKANAYGHGAAQCAKALAEDADAFAVAFTDEALSLRAEGIATPILVLEGVFTSSEVDLAAQHALWLVVHTEEQLRMLETSSAAEGSISVWLKVNSGMNRAGVQPSEVRAFWERLRRCPAVSSVRFMTHLASADEPENSSTIGQLQLFKSATEGLPGERSMANSAGLLGWQESKGDWARPGLMLYGVDPLLRGLPTLRPVMTLKSRIFADRWIDPGEAVGYGATFVAERRIRIGLVAMGYADGYPRNAPTGTPVSANGAIVRTVGRVSMDMLSIDLTNHPDVGNGTEVELWGGKVPVAEVATAAKTIPYELLCNVKRVRVEYI